MHGRIPLLVVAVLLTAVPLAVPQGLPQPDLGPAGQVVDEAAGTVLPPALNATYNATGQNITREDVRLFLDVNFTKGDVGLGGLLIGSGNIEVQARIDIRGELRVISSERIRAAIEGENAYNVSAENATWLSSLYLPAEVFRASASAEVIAAFQEEQERALRDYIEETVPELELLSLDVTWSNTFPTQAFTDTSLTDPPIVVELEAVVRYLRVESVPSLLSVYTEGRDDPEADKKKQYVQNLKEENGDPLRARDFFAAAAYTQLLNLSMQPGWSLDVHLTVPSGYSFEYVNEEVERPSEREVAFQVDAVDEDEEQQEVVLASITHRRAVAVALFSVMWLGALAVAFPARYLYSRKRIPKIDHDD